MKKLVEATYTPIERGGKHDAPVFVERLLAGDLPAFVISASGPSLRKALSSTQIDHLLRLSGYDGDVKTSVQFEHGSAAILPADPTDLSFFEGDEWAKVGVTALHTDKHRVDQEQQYSLNHTRAGRSDFRLHPSRLSADQLDDQWDILDKQTGALIWYSLVDPELIAPEGHRAVISPGDLLVFDPLHAHIVRSLETPRISEATFFQYIAV